MTAGECSSLKSFKRTTVGIGLYDQRLGRTEMVDTQIKGSGGWAA